VKNAVEEFKKGELKETIEPNVTTHFGVGGGQGKGRGFRIPQPKYLNE